MTVSLSGARRAVRRRPWVSAAAVVVLVGGGITAYVLVGGDDSSSAATSGTTSRLVSATTGTLSEAVSASGTFAPADEEDVSFSSAAQITSVRVTQGQKVTKGQVLGTIATVSLKATLAQARATLATAESTLATAQDSSDTTDAQLDADNAAVTSAHSAVSDAKTALADATLRSPIAGTVATVNVAVGDESSGSGSSTSSTSTTSGASSTSGGSGQGGAGGGSTGSGGTGSGSGSSGTSDTSGTTGSSSSSSSSGDFVVVGMKSWTVSASVDDTEVGLIAKGDQAKITTDNVTATVFGTVSSVSVLSSSSSGSATYPVTIAVTGSPSGLHDGASATISIVYKQLSNVLTVSTLAVHRAGTSSYVYVSKSGKKTKQTVVTGLSSGGETQIKSGLTSGQQVYVESVARTGGSGNSNSRSGNSNGGGFPGGGSGNFPGGGNGGGFGGGNGGGFGGGGR